MHSTWKWFWGIGGALVLLCCGTSYLAVRLDGEPGPRAAFPPELVPPGARVVSVSPGETDQCWAHQVALVADAGALDTWAKTLALPCVDDAGACTSWSTSARASHFWERDLGDVEGLDTLDASLDGGLLRLDWGDYLCSGWN